MVYQVDSACLKALEGTHGGVWVATAFYGGQATIPGPRFPRFHSVPITPDGDLTFDGDAAIQATGTVHVSGMGASLVPHNAGDPLAPFGAELGMVYRVTSGGTVWDVPVGRFAITEVPDLAEKYPGWPQQRQVLGWAAELNLSDRLERIQADDFLTPEAPEPGNSAWDEMARISPVPVVRSLPDAMLPAGVTYSSRLGAMQDLARYLGGELAVGRDGSVTVRKGQKWLTETATVATVTGVVNVGKGMSGGIVNSVSLSNPNDANVVAFAEITDPSNPFSVPRMGRRTRKLTDPLATDQVKADNMVGSALARLSTQRARTVKVSCLPRPDLDLGDFIRVQDQASPDVYTGEVRRMRFSLDPAALMDFDLQVAEVL